MAEPRQFSVSPGAQPLQGFSAPTPRDYGSQQLQQAGQAIQQAGAQASTIYADQLRQANQLRVDEALTQLKEKQLEYTYGNNGFTRAKGHDALFRPSGKSLQEDYGDLLDKDAQAIGEGLGNDVQRQVFTRAAREIGLGFRADVTKHEAGEFDTYALSVTEGVIANRQREMALGYADPDKTDIATQSIRAQVAQQGKLAGRSADWIEARTVEMLSTGHSAAIASMLQDDDVSAAEKYFDMHRSEMSAADIFQTDVAIGKQQDVQVATGVVNEVFASGTGSAARGQPQQLMMPVRGAVGSTYGVDRGDHKHGGIDIPVAVGSAVSAPADGVVHIKMGGDYGNMVVIDHGGGVETRMAHLSAFDVKEGQAVQQGQVVGRSGGAKGASGAGNSTGPHMHYEVRVNGETVDPTQALKTKARASGGSLLDMTQALREDPRLANSPQRLAEAERQLRSLYSAREEAKRNSEEDAANAGYKWLAQNGGKLEKMPAALRNAIPGNKLPEMQSFSTALQKPPSSARSEEAALPLWGKLKEAVASGTISKPDQLLQFGPYLPNSLYKDLVTDVIAIQKGDTTKIDSMKTVTDAIGYVDVELAKAGIDKKDKPELYSQFRGELLQQISAAERLKGKPLSGEESRAIALGLLGDSAVNSRGWFGTTIGAKPMPNYKTETPQVPFASIPMDMRYQIAQSLRRRRQMYRPSDIEREYNLLAGVLPR